MRKIIRNAAISALVLLILIQFVPYSVAEIEPQGEISPPPEVQAILERSCFDCHSAKTKTPWYGHVAPVSWLITHDVEEGREHLNFSNWALLSAKDQAEAKEEIWEEVEKGEMPLAIYVAMHGEAKLSDQDREVLRAWCGEGSGGTLRRGEVEVEEHD